MKLYTHEIGIYDNDMEPQAVVKVEDSYSIVEMKEKAHTPESWDELSAAIWEAFLEVCKE